MVCNYEKIISSFRLSRISDYSKIAIAGLFLMSLSTCLPTYAQTHQESTNSPIAASSQTEVKAPNNSGSIEQTAALIDGHEILVSEVDAELSKQPQLRNILKLQPGEEALKQLRTEAVNSIINRRLLLGAANEAKVAADPKDVESVMTGIIQRAGGADKFADQLKAMNMTIDNLKEELAQEMQISAYLQNLLKDGQKISKEQVQKQFNDDPTRYSVKPAVHVRHILLKLSEDASTEEIAKVSAQIQSIYVDAQKPDANFSSLAKQYSECPSAPQGGDLGFIEKGQTVKPFEEAAFTLEVGQISQPVRSQFGFHIIKAEEVRKATTPSFEEVEAQVQKDVVSEMQHAAINKKLVELRNKAKIEILL